VALALANAIRKHQMSRPHLEALIDSREADMVDEPPADLAALERYAESSSARLVLLALEVLGVREAAAIAAGREVGIAYALAGLMRAVPFHARARRIFLPGDLVDETARRALLELRPHAALASAVAAVTQRARAQLARARARRAEIPRAALPALLTGVLAQRSLDRLAQAKYDVFARALARPDALLVTRLGLAAWRNRY
jgi:phytoene synthase